MSTEHEDRVATVIAPEELGALVAAFVLMDPTSALWASRNRDVAEGQAPADSLGLTASTR